MDWLHYAGLVCLGLLILWAVAKADDWIATREKRD